MSDLFDGLNQNAGVINYYAQVTALHQRRDQIKQQAIHTEAIQQQTRELEKNNQIEKDRAEIERQRLMLEKRRAQAEESEREQRRLQSEQVRQIRVLMADCLQSIEQLKKIRPAP